MTTNKKTDGTKKNRKKGETIKEKIHRHLRDKDDIITDEDIRDAVAGSEYAKESEEKVQDDLNADESEEKKNTSAWKIVNS
jgi:hypothetical protein